MTEYKILSLENAPVDMSQSIYFYASDLDSAITTFHESCGAAEQIDFKFLIDDETMVTISWPELKAFLLSRATPPAPSEPDS